MHILRRPTTRRPFIRCRFYTAVDSTVFCSAGISGVGRKALWTAMKYGIVEPELFLPVSRVRVSREPEHDRVWRTMRYDGSGALHGEQLFEHVYACDDEGEIRFVALDGDGNEHLHEIVQSLLTSPLRIQYTQRNRLTLERLQSLTSNVYLNAHERDSTGRAIELIVEMAQDIEEADDDDDFASGAWS